MRMAAMALAGFVIVMVVLALTRDLMRPAPEVELGLAELGEIDEATLTERLSELRLDCTEDEAVEPGARACFAPADGVDGYDASYLALFYDAEQALEAVNIVLDPAAHEANRARLDEHLGEPDETIDEAPGWLVWERGEHFILSHAEPPEDEPPVLMWFRDAEAAARLRPE